MRRKLLCQNRRCELRHGARRRFLQAITLTLLATWAVPIGADAASLHKVIPNVVRFASDGARWIAWQARARGPITMLDTHSGERHSIASAGCELANEVQDEEPRQIAAAGEFLLTCAGHEELLSAYSGRRLRLPAEAPSAQLEWTRVGSRFVEGLTLTQTCTHTPVELKRRGNACTVLYDLATGSVTYRPNMEVIDLDKPSAPRECSEIQGAELLEEREPAAYGEGVLALPAHPGDGVQLIKCRGGGRRLRERGEPGDFRVGGGIVTWDNGLQASLGDVTREEKMVTSYRVRDGHRQTWGIPLVSVEGQLEPTPPGPYGFATHTSNTVYWLAARAVTPGESQAADRWSVYSAAMT